jgi:acetylornithine deacetylase/succinyl-diaminopimelate desuccinylase-like protein
MYGPGASLCNGVRKPDASFASTRSAIFFARRNGTQKDAPAVMCGSHLDTQPAGGRFDGVYGVLAGLEVIRILNELDVSTRHPIEVVA